jgi:hypothetical protein
MIAPLMVLACLLFAVFGFVAGWLVCWMRMLRRVAELQERVRALT